MGDERVSEERLRYLAQHWPSEMRAICHELIAAREELLALRAREERMRAALSALVRAISEGPEQP